MRHASYIIIAALGMAVAALAIQLHHKSDEVHKLNQLTVAYYGCVYASDVQQEIACQMLSDKR